MATIFEEKQRNVIPRWRDFDTTVAIGELKSSVNVISLASHSQIDHLALKIRDWRRNKSISFAADVVGLASVLNRREEAIEVAQFILEKEEEASLSLLEIASKIINPSANKDVELQIDEKQSIETEYIYTKIHKLRTVIREEPRNSILYVDLARAYTLIDENNKAIDVINIALKLNPDNRFILRSAARLFLHDHKDEDAHKILRQAEIGKYDSWVAAAEIAVASTVNNPSRFAKNGFKLLADNKLTNLEITELATALSMLEIESGKQKTAKKLIKKAILSPTENSLAQIEWAARNRISLDSINLESFINVPLIHEAKALELFNNREFDKALNESWKWFYDQPFSIRPVELGSYIASTFLGDYQKSINLLKKGQISNPNDLMILNNLAFCYASLNDVTNAKETFNNINLSGVDERKKIVLTATEGLIAFRSGELKKGRAKYIDAIERARANSMVEIEVKAQIYHAREEKVANTTLAKTIEEKVLRKLRKLQHLDLNHIAQRELLKGEKL